MFYSGGRVHRNVELRKGCCFMNKTTISRQSSSEELQIIFQILYQKGSINENEYMKALQLAEQNNRAEFLEKK